MFGIKINKMKEELEDLVEYIIYRAEFHAGSNEDEKLANSTETKEMIEQYTTQRVIEELNQHNQSQFRKLSAEELDVMKTINYKKRL